MSRASDERCASPANSTGSVAIEAGSALPKMNRQPSLSIDFTFTTLSEAYVKLAIENSDISDGDVVAAFHTAYHEHGSDRARFWCIKVLEITAHRCQSQLLAFAFTIIPHLTKDNVHLLASPPDEANEQSGVEPCATKSDISNTVVPDQNFSSSNIALEGVYISTPANSSDGDDVEAPSDYMSISSGKTSSTGVPSSGEDTSGSDSDEYVGGRFWDGQSWRCEECNDVLVQGRCPNGDVVNPCRLCGRQCEGFCPVVCRDCHKELSEQCPECDDNSYNSDQSVSEDCLMVWDDLDEIWMCKDCLWEIEVNSESEGHCHCLIDQEEPESNVSFPWNDNDEPSYPAPFKAVYPIELLYYHDYEPADSDSSGPESVDSDPDSDDEAFIEDDGPFRPELMSCNGRFFLPDDSQPVEGGHLIAGIEPQSMNTT